MAIGHPPAFICMDLCTQEDFLGPEGVLRCENADLVLKRLHELLPALRKHGKIIIQGNSYFQPEDPFFKRWKLPPHCVAGTLGQNKIYVTADRAAPIIPANGKRRPWPDMQTLKQRGGGLALDKSELDLFANPALDEILRTLGSLEILLFGAPFEMDLGATALKLRDHMYGVTIIEDCTGYRDKDRMLHARGMLVKRDVKFTNCTDVLTRLAAGE